MHAPVRLVSYLIVVLLNICLLTVELHKAVLYATYATEAKNVQEFFKKLKTLNKNVACKIILDLMKNY